MRRDRMGTHSARTAARAVPSVKVVGLGGIGGHLAPALIQFLSWLPEPCSVWLIDGDAYEERNRERMIFQAYGNKAAATARELAPLCRGGVTVLPAPEYVTPRSARRLIEEGDVVFLCVDNHATRKVASDRCRRLDDVVLISGGNDGVDDGREGTFGNVQVYIRERGRDITNPLTRFHPEIARPRDKRPDERGCAAATQTEPQLLFTNVAVASAMLSSFYAWRRGRLAHEEVYLDILLGRTTPVQRAAPRRPEP